MNEATIKTNLTPSFTLTIPHKISITTQITTNNIDNFMEIEIRENNSKPLHFSFTYNRNLCLWKFYEKQFLYKNLNNLGLSDTIKTSLKKYYFPLKPTVSFHKKPYLLKLDPSSKDKNQSF